MKNKARVTTEYKGAYKVKNEHGEFLAKVTGKRIFDALSREDYPAVGDWVIIEELPEQQAVIKKILPRKTVIKRMHKDRSRIGGKNETQIIATNIDVAFVVESVDRDFNLNRFERYFAIAKDGGVKPTIILNKIDLISKEELDIKLAQVKNRFNDVDFIPTSIITDEGLSELKMYMKKGKTYCFLGSSGVGKSSLINKLLGENIIKTENISISTGKGKHTTTSREMYFLENGAIVVDNPGMREVGMTDTGLGIDNLFDEIMILAKNCKYVDCIHIHEPGCKVLSAVKSGELDKDKYLNYVSLKREVEHYEMTKLEKREKDKQFGKFVKNAKKELKKYKH
ncbi:MAG: ribosome small subunit-dependent GTPase A [Candidatus Staskawiczbacteria bacterium RIFOXYD2_FULL_37_9]|uniref:Small ribosomal subunit biogenesis GTPase RsgA n=1 Tax=Candidatus Staskawiczbacteria bacterium RIFOXYB1_FULL_37_44 TaxID=1802223 RepID=A0A1G2IWE4_9BACT|nr:MAG: ribosome small subunit-dependent GTPase A [Candidatus Staskawiczbacteria bacterium RIFOXYB1_FULL_37_44]OGZ83869.1 MAG: ribosome small subunit-dependent GTPase A [Candidatus Staskawiczbacteria bacterium RIFOXYC1_FULL_37_52]OGZ87585.1 MAG: ribosome small subunit-dependent GTPase A [Candidatus Staskawiczbacteria bacterium RIFOXYC2_FULL_37_19]OGZ89376.1 MAG: ribosome small subunit-dependent GTPase A [Candidatus Staskawiczbacteria bacterium RIFOXYD1_FULL_37_110]OGZ94192.1 MAG: ribosome small